MMRTGALVSVGMLLLASIVSAGCSAGGTAVMSLPPGTLANQVVSIGPGGGWASIGFQGSSGQRVRITLTASNTALRPYEYLENPDGTGSYTPPMSTAHNGVNSVEVNLTQTGSYVLTVFDGSNLGGTVTVLVTVI